ncbi:MAG TPA: Gfo/Idh/MocA family oxidoreductase [Flavisolibacter sp.]|nr:Gfo/Idh/MocA family oxidoreductase [Flavisolibacter sp.]
MEINWGIIGCGDVTEIKSGPAFNKVPCSRLVAVMRRNAARAQDYAERHRVPTWYSDARQLIDDPAVTAVYIATPPSSHEQYAIEALRSGKPVYLEKPMSTDAASARRIAAAAKETGVKLSIAHYRRKQPLFLKVRSLLDEKVIGDIRLVNLQCHQPHLSRQVVWTEDNWRLNPAVSGGGLFHDLAPHQLDLMRYFFGPVKAASGIAVNVAGLYEADDTVSGQIVFKNGVLFTGSWSFVVDQKKDFCEIIGTKGTIAFSIFEHQPLIIIRNGKEEKFVFDKLEHVQQPMIDAVVQYFLGHGPNPCSADEGAEIMELIDAFTGRR